MSAVFGLATVIAVFFVGRDGRGIVSGLVAAAVVATNPYFVHLSWVIHMEVPMSFFLVLALYLLMHDRPLAAGLAIAVAVTLKEIALAFWLPAAVYIFARGGFRRSLLVGLPAPVALAAWLLIANAIDAATLRSVLGRWLNSVGGTSTWDKRFDISPRRWLKMIALDIVSPPLTSITIIAIVLGLLRRTRVPPIVLVPLAYSALTVAVTFLIRLKEDRWLTAVIPMSAVAVGLLVDWGALARWPSLRGPRAREPARSR